MLGSAKYLHVYSAKVLYFYIYVAVAGTKRTIYFMTTFIEFTVYNSDKQKDKNWSPTPI